MSLVPPRRASRRGAETRGQQAFLAALLLAGCGRAAPPAQAPGVVGPPEDVNAQARSVIAAVVKLRGLTEVRPVETRVVSDARFGELFATKLKKEQRPKDAARGVLTPSESYLGFYDEFSKVIVLRDHVPKWASDAGVQPQDLLAHEVVHALQDQHFGIPETARIDDDDRLLAVQALYEGDAQLVMEAFHAQRQHQSWKRAALFAYEAADLAPEVGIRTGLFSPSLLDLPPARRTTITFPYLSGVAFASALFRAGGFALIDRALAHPPETTADILEPERYFAGEHPKVIRALPTPPGSVRGLDAPIGELGLSVFLVTLLSPARTKEAMSAVRGWNGARMTQFSGPTGTLLASEWKGDGQARRFEALLRTAIDSTIPENAREACAIARDGTSVTFACGPDAAPAAKRLLHVADDAPAAEPRFGSLALPPPPVPLSKRADLRGAVVGSRYESRWLGVRGAIPPGFGAESTSPEAQLIIVRRAPSVAVGTFSLFQGTLRPQQLHSSFVEGVVSATANTTRPIPLSAGPRETPFGAGTQATWRVSIAGKTMFARSVAVDECDGRAAFQWGSLWADGDGANALDAWTASFQPLSPGRLPACDDIRKETAEEGP